MAIEVVGGLQPHQGHLLTNGARVSSIDLVGKLEAQLHPLMGRLTKRQSETSAEHRQRNWPIQSISVGTESIGDQGQ